MTSKKKIGFVTDSTCDLWPDIVKKYSITVVSCFVNYGGNSYADNGVELVREEFYDKLPTISPHPTTAAPPPGLSEQMIKQAFQDADHLIIISVSAKLSAVFNSLRLGSGDLPQDKVTLVDSEQASMGLGWQVLIGAQVAEETGDVLQVLDAMRRVRANQQVYAAAATLEYLRRSGRVSNVIASLGSLLQIKPFIKVINGEVENAARVRTFKSAMDKLVELIKAEAPLNKLAVLHANNPTGAEEIHTRLGSVAPPDTVILSVSPTIGVHIGPGSLGAATVSQKWRD
jgi:DegV family protein with EDD domain